ncbi:MAG: hypothetical protein JXB26_08860 [Candidatus Aminicenantes bacterium]|nr:hypothetical protein [Candidatus Aminicenantes bacterium]
MEEKNNGLRGLFIIILILVGSWTILEAEEVTSDEMKVRVLVEKANVRLKPLIDSLVISHIPLGTVLTYQAKKGDWYKVELPKKEQGFKIIGYIHKSIVEEIGRPATPQQQEKEVLEEIFEENMIRVITSQGEVMSAPDQQSGIIARAPAGSLLFSTRKIGPWFRVEIKTGETGYIHADKIEVVEEETTSEPEAVEEKRQKEEVPEIVEEERPRERKIYPPPPPPPEEEPIKRQQVRKLYIKGYVGFGAGFDKIFTGYVKRESGDDEYKDVNIYPGGGVNLELLFGYRFLQNLMLELGIGYQSSGDTAGDDSVSFSRFPLKMTLVFEFPSSRNFKFYTGAGAGAYLGPKYKEEIGSSKGKITFGGSFGMHALLGIAFHQARMSYFIEMKYEGLMNYTWKDASLNGYSGVPSAAFEEMSGNGIFFNFGIGYRF